MEIRLAVADVLTAISKGGIGSEKLNAAKKRVKEALAILKGEEEHVDAA